FFQAEDGIRDLIVTGVQTCALPISSRVPWRARLQDSIQPAWTWAAGGCHPNRETEAAVERAGFRIEPEGRRAEGTHRRFAARIRSEERRVGKECRLRGCSGRLKGRQ